MIVRKLVVNDGRIRARVAARRHASSSAAIRRASSTISIRCCRGGTPSSFRTARALRFVTSTAATASWSTARRCREQALKPGDVVQLGHLHVRYVEDTAVDRAQEDHTRAHATTATGIERRRWRRCAAAPRETVPPADRERRPRRSDRDVRRRRADRPPRRRRRRRRCSHRPDADAPAARRHARRQRRAAGDPTRRAPTRRDRHDADATRAPAPCRGRRQDLDATTAPSARRDARSPRPSADRGSRGAAGADRSARRRQREPDRDRGEPELPARHRRPARNASSADSWPTRSRAACSFVATRRRPVVAVACRSRARHRASTHHDHVQGRTGDRDIVMTRSAETREDRPLSGARTRGQGRHGRALSRVRSGPRSRGRDQADARGLLRRHRADAPALLPRSARRRQTAITATSSRSSSSPKNRTSRTS